MSEIKVSFDKRADVVTINLSSEGALYVASVLEDEFCRSADAGAAAIEREIREALDDE